MARRRIKLNKRSGSGSASRSDELQDLIWSGLRWVLISLGAMIVLWLLVTFVLGVARTKPDTAKEIIEHAAAKDTGSYAAEYEALRRVEYDQDVLQRAIYARIQYDRKAEAYSMNMLGVTQDESALFVQHVKGQTIYATQETNDGWRTAPDLKTSEIDALSARNIAKMHPKLEKSDATFRGSQAWVLSFKPTPEALASALYANHLQLLGSSSPKELAEVRAGKYTLNWAYAWVPRNSEQLSVVDIRFNLASGAEYRFRIKYASYGGINLKGLKLRRLES